MESPCFSRPQSTASHLFARTRSFHRPTYKRPGFIAENPFRSVPFGNRAFLNRAPSWIFEMATLLRIPFFFDHPTACVACRLFEKLICSNERSTKFGSLHHGQKYLAEENGKMVALKISPKIESLYGFGRQATKL